ncbi:MAG: rhodanese-like domain-containing protein [Candidatus Levybacteria bacterium]|nr:rhodanese-like domain-containing protein [Candidatus Levybacteria bacterium]
MNVAAQDLKNKIDSGEKVVIVDVRTPAELVRGRITGAINIPLDFFEDSIEKKVPDKNANVYLYCLSGSRSILAAKIMEQKGYKNVFNLLSGLLGWRAKGFSLGN